MSAPPPAQNSSMPAPLAPNTGPVPARRQKPPVSIFTPNKRLQKKAVAAKKPIAKPASAPLPKPERPEPAPGTYKDYPIIIRKTAEDEGLHHHIFKLMAKHTGDGKPIIVNPYDPQQFERPLTLHRRAEGDKRQVAEPEDVKDGDNKDFDMLTARHAARVAEREENQKLIAPGAGEGNKPANKKKPQKKVVEGRDDLNPEYIKRQQLRYDEARPWHLEDAGGENVWVGRYEEALSDQYIMFVVTEEGHFKMVPVEKWYRARQQKKMNTMTSEQAEAHMAKKFEMPRWAMGTQLANDYARQEKAEQQKQAAATRRRQQREDDDLFGEDTGEYQADKDGLDMDMGDTNEFQDDDEGELYMDAEGEDGKEIERRIREEMRNAGLGGTGFHDENIDPEEEYQKEQLARAEEAKLELSMRKALMKRENKREYEFDDNEDGRDPYASNSSEDSDEELEAAEEESKQDEASKAGPATTTKSGASSKGNNTPTGRVEKKDPARLNVLGAKRPGSPDLSEFSGNESGLKKKKTNNGRAVSTSDPKLDAFSINRGSGSGSDSDTTRTGRTTIRLNAGKRSPISASPNHSRAASPAVAAPGRVTTPKPTGAGQSNAPFPTLEDVQAAIPAEGVEIKTLIALFRNKVNGRNHEFIALVKSAGQQEKGTGKIVPKKQKVATPL